MIQSWYPGRRCLSVYPSSTSLIVALITQVYIIHRIKRIEKSKHMEGLRSSPNPFWDPVIQYIDPIEVVTIRFPLITTTKKPVSNESRQDRRREEGGLLTANPESNPHESLPSTAPQYPNSNPTATATAHLSPLPCPHYRHHLTPHRQLSQRTQ